MRYLWWFIRLRRLDAVWHVDCILQAGELCNVWKTDRVRHKVEFEEFLGCRDSSGEYGLRGTSSNSGLPKHDRNSRYF
jgi:hypothetical protein